MDHDPMGLAGLSPDVIAAVTPFADQSRDNALAIVQTVFGKMAEITDAKVGATTGLDVETQLVGDFFLIEVNLQSATGELFPCLSFVHRDELVAALELDIPADPADWSEQVQRLENPVELLIEALNAQLGAAAPGGPTFVRPSVRTVSLPDDAASLLLAPDEQLIEVSYQLSVSDVGELAVITVAAVDFVQHLAEAEGGPSFAAARSPVGASAGMSGLGGLPGDLLSQVPDPFGTPTGRTSADILGDLSGLDDVRLGGLGMTGGAGAGMASAASRGGGMHPDVGAVRPVQFQQFGEPADRDSGANIDLLMDVNLRVTVELGRTSMTIKEILELGPGAVVELDKLAGEPVDILVNDKPIAKGEVVVVDENFGVRVTDIVSAARRVTSLR
jgi:flagellar motor switch protein FliN/FliY